MSFPLSFPPPPLWRKKPGVSPWSQMWLTDSSALGRLTPASWLPADELTVPRYRTEKPSKSPPPPPPRRSFPSSHGLTTTRTGEVVVTSKKDSAFIKVPPLEPGGQGVGLGDAQHDLWRLSGVVPSLRGSGQKERGWSVVTLRPAWAPAMGRGHPGRGQKK